MPDLSGIFFGARRLVPDLVREAFQFWLSAKPSERCPDASSGSNSAITAGGGTCHQGQLQALSGLLLKKI